MAMVYQVTDPIQIEDALRKLIKHTLYDELRHFEEAFFKDGINNFHGLKSVEEMIGEVKKVNGGTEHILYSILVLMSAYPEIMENEGE